MSDTPRTDALKEKWKDFCLDGHGGVAYDEYKEWVDLAEQLERELARHKSDTPRPYKLIGCVQHDCEACIIREEQFKEMSARLARYENARMPDEPLEKAIYVASTRQQYVPRDYAEKLIAYAASEHVRAEEAAAELVAARKEPTIEECFAAGKGPEQSDKFREGGLPNTPEERARFEAYMRGHCWEVGKYDEALRGYDTVISRMLYGVWRDRGMLAAIKPTEIDHG